MTEAPEVVVGYLGGQLDVIDPVACVRLYANAETQRHHAREIRWAYGYHQFHDQPYPLALTRWLLSRAWLAGERPITLGLAQPALG